MNAPEYVAYCAQRRATAARRRSRLAVAVLVILLALVAAFAPRPARADDERFEPSSRGYDAVERWRPLISQYEWDTDTALAIVRCESGGDPTVPNRQGSGALGLFQVMPMWQPLANALYGYPVSRANAEVNVRVAFALYLDYGWSPWYSSRGCWGWR